MKGEDEWEECPICMEPTKFIWNQLCCGRRICFNCMKGHNKYESTGVRPLCPFCRAPEITGDTPKYQSQIRMFAEKGKAWAQADVGDMYRLGVGVDKSMEKAFYYYNLAAEQAHSRAQGWLGDFYLNGDGVPLDYEKALHYYKLSAEGDHLPSYNSIGYMYEKGLGVSKSSKIAFLYFKLGADKGNELAQSNVGMCYYHGNGVEKDVSLAIKYFSLSADQNNKEAIVNLPFILIQELERNNSYLFQGICRTKIALQIMKESDKKFTVFKDFLEWSKTYCGCCGASKTNFFGWRIQNLISKTEHNKGDLLACGGCKVMMYCNKTCQKRHWKKEGHKQECKK